MVSCAAMVGAGLLLAGCGSNVELQGGVFDALGVSTSALQASKQETKLEPRAGIVLPPSTERLPVPGSAPTTTDVAARNGEFPMNPEDRARQTKDQQLAEHNAFCEKAMIEAKAYGKDTRTVTGPLGRCDPGVFERLTGKDPLANLNKARAENPQ